MAYIHETPTTAQSNQTSEMVVVGENSLYVAAIAENNSGAVVIAAKKRKLRLRNILNSVRIFAAFMAAIGLFAHNVIIVGTAFIVCLAALTLVFVISFIFRDS